MRGKERSCHSHQCVHGITPAYAGKRAELPFAPVRSRDYPRVCGEKRKDTLDYYYPQGSPPRMRGKAVPAALPDVTHGITPAYAGKRNGRCSCSTAGREHPRVCGEKTSSRQSTSCCRGSPPRVRGKERLLPEKHTSSGITPAYAGKSRSRRTTVRPLRDHPRVCGEKHLCSQLERPPPGSPPRVRGKAGL